MKSSTLNSVRKGFNLLAGLTLLASVGKCTFSQPSPEEYLSEPVDVLAQVDSLENNYLSWSHGRNTLRDPASRQELLAYFETYDSLKAHPDYARQVQVYAKASDLATEKSGENRAISFYIFLSSQVLGSLARIAKYCQDNLKSKEDEVLRGKRIDLVDAMNESYAYMSENGVDRAVVGMLPSDWNLEVWSGKYASTLNEYLSEAEKSMIDSKKPFTSLALTTPERAKEWSVLANYGRAVEGQSPVRYEVSDFAYRPEEGDLVTRTTISGHREFFLDRLIEADVSPELLVDRVKNGYALQDCI